MKNIITAETSRSANLYQRGCQVMPGGVSRNTVLRSPHPLYAERGEGCYVSDIEGIKRIDIVAPNIARKIQPGQFVSVCPEENDEHIPLTVTSTDAERGHISLIFPEFLSSTVNI